MLNIPSVRLTVPRSAAGEIVRKDLINTVLDISKKLVYIHAGAGYGKTTLLSQDFRMRTAYDPILEFAHDNEIEPEITRQMMEFAGYKPKKVYIETLGAFTVYQDKDRQKPLKFRTKKERELLAFLLDAGDQGATKEQIYNAIWWESESNNIKNLIGVNLGHIKNDLESASIEESVICRENRYFICRDEIECDIDLFERAYEEFKLRNTEEPAKKLLSLYKGEYLFGFEALWAVSKKIKCREIYEEAAKFCL